MGITEAYLGNNTRQLCARIRIEFQTKGVMCLGLANH